MIQNGSSAIIDLSNHDPDVVERMVYFFYHGEYPGLAQKPEPLASPTIETPDSTVLLVSEIDGSVLRKKSKKKKKSGLINGAQSTDKIASVTDSAVILHAHVYAIAEEFIVPLLKSYAAQKCEEAMSVWNIVDFVEGLKIIYGIAIGSEHVLKEAVLRNAAEHTKDLCESSEFAALCKENGEVAFDILKASLAVSTISGEEVGVEKLNSLPDQILTQ